MGIPRICVTVTGTTTAELRARRDAVEDADLVEVRLDGVRDPSPAGVLAGRRRPVIVTCRPRWEGGRFDGAEETRLGLLAEAWARGAEYVDVEWRAEAAALFAQSGGHRIILSMHDFDGVPADLAARVRAMGATGAEVLKVAVTAHTLCDQLALLPLARGAGVPVVVLAMGESGLASRLLPGRFGSCWTYAGDAAPGQLSLVRMVDEFGVRRAGPHTRLYGVLGRPVLHSVSPAMHNAAFRAARLDAMYLPLAAADLDDFFAFADALGIEGASVTAPFKQAAFDRADESDPVSRRVRAVNTLQRTSGRWIGCNTDVSGFLASLPRDFPLTGRRVSVLGAGGAARSVVSALASVDAAVTIHARRPEPARDLAAACGAAVGAWPPERGSWDMLVHATPVGTFPHTDETPVPAHLLSGLLVYDLVYNPSETRLLREARAAGCRVMGGLDMLVAQAHEQFVWWTGERPAEGVMRAAAEARLREMEQERELSCE